MNRLPKVALKSLTIAFVLVTAIGVAGGLYLWQRPSLRFLFSHAGLRETNQCDKEELVIPIDGLDTSVMVYRHRSIKSDRYYYFQHGHAPQKNKHPTLDRLARSLCDATAVNVLIPAIEVEPADKSAESYFERIATVYQTLVKKFPGHYRGFGSCIGANALLVALKRVPESIYPEKMLLTSPFFSGKSILRSYNKRFGSVEGFDILFKLVVTLESDAFDEGEKALIRKAIAASKPGDTDTGQMKTILGQKLFRDIVVLEARHEGLEQIGPETMFAEATNRPPCRYFILHSKHDRIVPYYQGKDLAKYMKDIGLTTSFLGTEVMAHTENKITVTGFLREATHLIRFFDALFEGDV